MVKPTVGLCIITSVSEDPHDIRSLISSFAGSVDHIYLQVNGPEGVNFEPWEMLYEYTDDEWLSLSYYTWNDNFADARNALLKEVKTEYWMWADSDDELSQPGLIRSTVQYMHDTNVDMLYCPYIYQYDRDGNPTEVQNRERIIRTDLPGAWHGAIHETWIPEGPAVRENSDKLQWIHRKDSAGHDESVLRNRRILEDEYRKTPRDPRIAYYLGLNYGITNNYTEAIEYFKELIDTGGWDEERYRSYIQIFSCYFELKDYEEAVKAALMATTELPEYPDAYFMLQQVYYELDDHQKALEWFRVGKLKPIPVSDSAFNPIVREQQPLALAAYSYIAIGEPKKALNTLLELQRNYPSYPINPALKEVTLEAVNEANAIDTAKQLIEFNKTLGGDPLAVLNSLPAALRSDVRLTAERRELIPGKKWSKGSIAIYCGPSFETWGPDTLDQGMGGSEEAVVYLARELSKLKEYPVTVFNQRLEKHSEYTSGLEFDDPDNYVVHYEPWTEINPNDTFDTFIQWRSPAGLENIKARKKILDLHDVMPLEDIYAAIPYVDTFMFKSQFHRDLYPEIPEDKVMIVGNGITQEHFS